MNIKFDSIKEKVKLKDLPPGSLFMYGDFGNIYLKGLRFSDLHNEFRSYAVSIVSGIIEPDLTQSDLDALVSVIDADLMIKTK